MAKLSGSDPIELPPGFRFHPTDEELITHYLFNKVIDSSFISRAIGEVDLNKVEPWDLPWMARMGENLSQWYFFCVRDRKYPTGLRTNRATEAGYWKATGKDKDIFRAITLIGMKKTLVFYTGRAPRGEKTNWVMHEYRLEGKHSMHNLPKTAKNEWVICRVFKKASGEKKVPISGFVSCGPDLQSLDLPSLMDLSDENRGDKVFDEFSSSSSKNCDFSFTYENSIMLQDQSIMRRVLDNNVSNTSQNGSRVEISEGVCYDEVWFKPHDDQELQMISTAPIELDCLWNY